MTAVDHGAPDQGGYIYLFILISVTESRPDMDISSGDDEARGPEVEGNEPGKYIYFFSGCIKKDKNH